ncbi:MAG: helix-turn-helix domain-containing protein [Candidatus Falkowbacteria bacterium]
MNKFISRQVFSEYKGIGEQLHLARVNKGLSINAAAAAVKTDPRYVEALEAENYTALPEGFYGKIFFKKYITFLGLDYKKVNKGFTKERKSFASQNNVFSKKVVKSSGLIVFPKIFRNILITSVVLICFLYLALYLKNNVTPPELKIVSPTVNQTQHDLSALVSGQTAPESEVLINGQSVLIDQNGLFSESINLKKGVNIIVIQSKKKYGQEAIVTRQILVE